MQTVRFATPSLKLRTCVKNHPWNKGVDDSYTQESNIVIRTPTLLLFSWCTVPTLCERHTTVLSTLCPLFFVSRCPSLRPPSFFVSSAPLYRRLRMTAGKAACSCRETSCFCRFKTTLASSTLARNLSQNPRTVPLPPPGPPVRPELDPRDLALVAEINRMAKGSRDRRESGGGGGRDAGAAPRATPAAAERGAAAGAAAGMRERLAVHMDCAFEFAERFVRRDIALAGRVQAVRLLNCR